MIAGGGALSALAAFIGASCCVLPLVLINLGLSATLVSRLAFFAKAQPYFMAVSALLIVAAFVAAFWNGRRPSKKIMFWLALAVLFAASAYILPYYEGQLIRWVQV